MQLQHRVFSSPSYCWLLKTEGCLLFFFSSSSLFLFRNLFGAPAATVRQVLQYHLSFAWQPTTATFTVAVPGRQAPVPFCYPHAAVATAAPAFRSSWSTEPPGREWSDRPTTGQAGHGDFFTLQCFLVYAEQQRAMRYGGVCFFCHARLIFNQIKLVWLGWQGGAEALTCTWPVTGPRPWTYSLRIALNSVEQPLSNCNIGSSRLILYSITLLKRPLYTSAYRGQFSSNYDTTVQLYFRC